MGIKEIFMWFGMVIAYIAATLIGGAIVTFMSNNDADEWMIGSYAISMVLFAIFLAVAIVNHYYGL